MSCRHGWPPVQRQQVHLAQRLPVQQRSRNSSAAMSADIAAFCRHCSYICCCCDQISSSIHQVYTSFHVQAVSQVYIQIQTRCSAMFTCPCAGADTKGKPALYSLPRQHSSTTCHQCIPTRAMSQWRLCCCAWQPPSAQQVRTLAQLHGTQSNVMSTKIQAISHVRAISLLLRMPPPAAGNLPIHCAIT